MITKSEFRDIIKEVALAYNVAPHCLLGRRRFDSYVAARQAAMAITHRRCGSLTTTAALFNRHHGAVSHAIGALSHRVAADKHAYKKWCQVRHLAVIPPPFNVADYQI